MTNKKEKKNLKSTPNDNTQEKKIPTLNERPTKKELKKVSNFEKEFEQLEDFQKFCKSLYNDPNSLETKILELFRSEKNHHLANTLMNNPTIFADYFVQLYEKEHYNRQLQQYLQKAKYKENLNNIKQQKILDQKKRILKKQQQQQKQTKFLQKQKRFFQAKKKNNRGYSCVTPKKTQSFYGKGNVLGSNSKNNFNSNSNNNNKNSNNIRHNNIYNTKRNQLGDNSVNQNRFINRLDNRNRTKTKQSPKSWDNTSNYQKRHQSFGMPIKRKGNVLGRNSKNNFNSNPNNIHKNSLNNQAIGIDGNKVNQQFNTSNKNKQTQNSQSWDGGRQSPIVQLRKEQLMRKNNNKNQNDHSLDLSKILEKVKKNETPNKNPIQTIDPNSHINYISQDKFNQMKSFGIPEEKCLHLLQITHGHIQKAISLYFNSEKKK
ncbi:hypothetical protein M0813_18891 [Anaeramoeba flamelloides]|uniref:UBA domain-containing protein n=1 Tax=Anaeramoeba flamelloides TaxID=1746091 RepID=A0ABQ8YS83_9EUKA|nr:hypothetical protein M0813_18891 [Anaeramoeba flamelloides]